MPTLTKAAFIKANEKMTNNFILDAQHYCFWGEKEAIKTIKLDEAGTMLQVKIEYHDKSIYKHFEKIANYDLVVSLSVWKPTGSGAYCSKGMGRFETISTGHEKKLFSKIQKETANYPDSKCLELYNAILTDEPEAFEPY